MRYEPTPQALVKPLDDGAIALNIDSGDYYTLNATAARMWTLLESGCSQREIVAAIVAEYAVAAADAERDLAHLIAELKEKALIADA